MATYRKALEETVRNPAPYVVPTSDPLYGSMTRLFIADTDDEARERALSAYRVYCDNFAFEGRFTSTEERERLVGNWQASRSGEEAPATVAAAMMDAERALEVGIVRAGSPETLRQYAMQYRESGANYFVASFQWGDLTHEEASRSMRLFAQEVMPVFD
jgi:alkanesulfonate monooxygenase SsuD/methylene tetrahydromethanopterin reductase-like flavin-dependent oxidoreductase (luciferase family)